MIRREWIAVLAGFAMLAAGTAGYLANRSAAVTREVRQPRLVVAPGYGIRQVADQLTTPIGAAVGKGGELYIAEAGAGTGTPPRVIRLGPGKQRKTVADDFPAPLTGLTYHEGKLYVSYAGGVDVLDPATGVHHPILTKLPAQGDHANGAVLFGEDGKLYFGIGSATNAGVIGQDNIKRGWVKTSPEFHDIPCKDVTVRGANFTIPNPLTPDPHDNATTGAFQPFGKTTARLQVVKGALPCTGAVLRANPDGTGLEMVAWGLRNPAGLAIGPDDQLYATMPGYQDRGSRPVVNDRDYLYLVEQDRWYGWPDYAGGRSVTEEEFQKPSLPAPQLLAEAPEQPPSPVADFEPGSGARGLIFPPEPFGLRGDALVAMFGSTLPHSPGARLPGNRVVRVNPRTGQARPFIRNEQEGPASAAGEPGLERPVAFTLGPSGEVYLVDYGQIRLGGDGVVEPVAGTGTLWRISRLADPQKASGGQVKWRWALVGLVLSVAGVQLVRRQPT